MSDLRQRLARAGYAASMCALVLGAVQLYGSDQPWTWFAGWLLHR